MSDDIKGWRETHIIRLDDGPVVLVMLEEEIGGGGPAYTLQEWIEESHADFERSRDGSWHRLGEAFNGTVEMVDPKPKNAPITARFDVSDETLKIPGAAIKVLREFLQSNADACFTARQVAEANILLIDAGLEPVFAIKDGRIVRFVAGDFDPVKAASLIIAAEKYSSELG